MLHMYRNTRSRVSPAGVYGLVYALQKLKSAFTATHKTGGASSC